LRWIIISDYLNYLYSRGISVKLILSLETDVLFLEDPLRIDTTVDWKHIEQLCQNLQTVVQKLFCRRGWRLTCRKKEKDVF